MIIVVESIRCPLCDWHYEEVDAERTIPPGLMQSFSDPQELARIMARDKEFRIEAKLTDHFENHSARDWAQKVRSLLADKARLDYLSAHPEFTEVWREGRPPEHGYAYTVVGHTSLTLREVLDAIMAATP